jgi:hypothetical protein
VEFVLKIDGNLAYANTLANDDNLIF